MKIQILSDIHLEFVKEPQKLIDELFINSDKETILALLGDIGRLDTENDLAEYTNLIRTASEKYRMVLVISGNHEYYNSKEYDMIEINFTIDSICNKFNNVYFLNNRSIEIDNYNILGCTLWSELDKKNKFIIETSINDFKYIYLNMPDEQYDYMEGTNCGVFKSSKLTFDLYNKLHKKDLEWIETEIKPDKKNIILTHHAPLIYNTQHKRYYSSPTKSAFCTELTNLVKRKEVIIWGFGHTHFRCDFNAYGTRIISNAVGYPNEFKNNKIEIINLE